MVPDPGEGLLGRVRRNLAGFGVIDRGQGTAAQARAAAVVGRRPVVDALTQRWDRVPGEPAGVADGPAVPIVYRQPADPDEAWEAGGPASEPGRRRPGQPDQSDVATVRPAPIVTEPIAAQPDGDRDRPGTEPEPRSVVIGRSTSLAADDEGGPLIAYRDEPDERSPLLAYRIEPSEGGPLIAYRTEPDEGGPLIAYRTEPDEGGPLIAYRTEPDEGGPLIAYRSEPDERPPLIAYRSEPGEDGPRFAYGTDVHTGEASPLVAYPIEPDHDEGGPRFAYGTDVHTSEGSPRFAYGTDVHTSEGSPRFAYGTDLAEARLPYRSDNAGRRPPPGPAPRPHPLARGQFITPGPERSEPDDDSRPRPFDLDDIPDIDDDDEPAPLTLDESELADVVERVQRELARRLDVERERRGVIGWP